MTIEKLTRTQSDAEARAAAAEQDLKQQLAALQADIQQLRQARLEAEALEAKTQQELKRERDSAFEQVVALTATVNAVTRAQSDAEARAVELSQL